MAAIIIKKHKESAGKKINTEEADNLNANILPPEHSRLRTGKMEKKSLSHKGCLLQHLVNVMCDFD